MTPVQRSISGALQLDLAAELEVVHEQLAASNRTARTVVKNGPLRATLVGLAAGGELAPHTADGPITLHVLEGAVEFAAGGREWLLPAGTLFTLEAGVVHSVRSASGGVFLLTVAVPTA